MKNKATADPAGTPADPVDAYTITDARVAHSDEMHHRMVKYALTMGIRMVCLILVFVLDGWLKIVAMAGAVFLPWIAVIIANAGADTTEEHATALLDEAPLAQLEAPRGPGRDPDDDVLQGEFTDDSAGGDGREDAKGRGGPDSPEPSGAADGSVAGATGSTGDRPTEDNEDGGKR